MPKPLRFLPEVLQELEETRDWYAERSPHALARFLQSLEQVLDEIAERPNRGAYHDERRIYRYRRILKFPYVAVYRDDDDHVLIVAVYHTSRHPDHWKESLQ